MTLFWTPFFGRLGVNPREKRIKRGSGFVKKYGKKGGFCPFFGDPQKWGDKKTPLFCHFLSKSAFLAKTVIFGFFVSGLEKRWFFDHPKSLDPWQLPSIISCFFTTFRGWSGPTRFFGFFKKCQKCQNRRFWCIWSSKKCHFLISSESDLLFWTDPFFQNRKKVVFVFFGVFFFIQKSGFFLVLSGESDQKKGHFSVT